MIPLAIMTSDDTHQMTVDLLEANRYFGMAEGQVTIMKQNKVWIQDLGFGSGFMSRLRSRKRCGFGDEGVGFRVGIRI